MFALCNFRNTIKEHMTYQNRTKKGKHTDQVRPLTINNFWQNQEVLHKEVG